jgi:hypothetical protein
MTLQELALGATIGIAAASANYAGARYILPYTPERAQAQTNIRPYLLAACMVLAAIFTVESWSNSNLLLDAVLTYEAGMGIAIAYDINNNP